MSTWLTAIFSWMLLCPLLVLAIEILNFSVILRAVSFLHSWRQFLISHSKYLLALFLWFQSDLEKREGLPVSPFMDRDKVNKNSSQVNFIRFVLLPLFDSLADLYPTIQVCLATSLTDNMILLWVYSYDQQRLVNMLTMRIKTLNCSCKLGSSSKLRRRRFARWKFLRKQLVNSF